MGVQIIVMKSVLIIRINIRKILYMWLKKMKVQAQQEIWD